MLPAPKDIMYVATQGVLFVVYLFRLSMIDFHAGSIIKYTGLLFAIFAVLLIVVSLVQLNKNLTPFPSPKKSSSLVTTGVYRYVRHPIYSGILLFTAGYGIYSTNTLRLLVCFTLLVLFIFKAGYEERQLIKKFPAYEEYKKTTSALLPGLY